MLYVFLGVPVKFVLAFQLPVASQEVFSPNGIPYTKRKRGSCQLLVTVAHNGEVILITEFQDM